MSRATDVERFYQLLSRREKAQGARRLVECTGSMQWPARGVYLFLDQSEQRAGDLGPRVVRVGTHALSAKSKTTLWQRLAQHRGSVAGAFAGGGNHRGSIFRLHVGAALIERGFADADAARTWGKGTSASMDARRAEVALERAVSTYIRELPFVWLPIDDSPGPGSLRGFVERNTIALLSNRGRPAVDQASEQWLGRASPNSAVRESGLWNVNHVDATHDATFLDQLAVLVD